MKLENKILDIKNKVESRNMVSPNLNDLSYTVRFMVYAMARNNMFPDLIRILRNGGTPRIFLF